MSAFGISWFGFHRPGLGSEAVIAGDPAGNGGY